MRSLEEIKRDYEATEIGDKIIPLPGYKNVYGMANQGKRDKLKEEYESGLPEDERLALLLHKKMCHSNHTDACSFNYEVKEGFIHDWSAFTHNMYLKRAHALLDVVSYDIALKIIDAINMY